MPNSSLFGPAPFLKKIPSFGAGDAFAYDSTFDPVSPGYGLSTWDNLLANFTDGIDEEWAKGMQNNPLSEGFSKASNP